MLASLFQVNGLSGDLLPRRLVHLASTLDSDTLESRLEYLADW